MALSLADGIEARSRARAVSVQRETASARAAERAPSRFSLDETEALAAREPAKTPSSLSGRTSDRASDRETARPAGDGHRPAKQAARQDRPAVSERPERDMRASERPQPAADRPERATDSQQASTDPAESATTRAGETEAAPRPRQPAGTDANPAVRGGSSEDGKLAKAEPDTTRAAGDAAEIPTDITGTGTDAGAATSDATEAAGAATQTPVEAGLAASALIVPATPAVASAASMVRTAPSAEKPADAVAADETAAGAGAARVDAAQGTAVQARRGKGGGSFETALSAATAEGGKDAAAAGQTAAADATATSIAAPAAATPAEAKAAATVQAAVPASATQAPPVSVPLGGVPMTIGLRALGGSSRFEIRLDPVELGHIEVAVEIDRERGTVGARLVVERPETLALLQRDASSLQQALAQTGLDASAGIALSLRGDGTGERNGGETGTGAQRRGPGREGGAGTNQAVEASALDRQPLRALRGLGGIDIRI